MNTPLQIKKGEQEIWQFRLYVAGQTPKTVIAFANLKRICDEHLKNQYQIEVIDLFENPKRAKQDNIFAFPTLVRKVPFPLKQVIGDLSDAEKLIIKLGFKTNQASQNVC